MAEAARGGGGGPCRKRGPAAAVAAVLLLPRPACAGGGVSLWALGDEVDKNPIIVFSMFCFVVFLTVVVESAKHSIEHKTKDHYRVQALGAIYAELMMVGIIAFLLILGAEMGLTTVKFNKPGCVPDEGATGSGSGSSVGSVTGGSQSGSQAVVATGSGSGDAFDVPCVWRLPQVGSGSGDTDLTDFECRSKDPCWKLADSDNSTYTCDAVPAPPPYPPPPLPPSPPPPAPPTASGSGSGSGNECEVGFDLLMFEYAHLVLFFMGIMYCAFIQICFWQRDRQVQVVKDVQSHSVRHWMCTSKKGFSKPSIMGIMGLGSKKAWARGVILLRNIMVIHHEHELKDCCDKTEEALIAAAAKYQGKPVPSPLPAAEEAAHDFDMARMCYIAMSEVMIELLHIPPVIWCVIAVVSSSNLIHMDETIDLALVTLWFAPMGLTLALVLLFAMAKHFSEVLQMGSGHSRITDVEFHSAGGTRGGENEPLAVPADIAKAGQDWERDPKEKHPWSNLDGCVGDESMFNACDPLDPVALERQIQMVILICCFYVGTIMMLTQLIVSHLGLGLGIVSAILCWTVPMIPLFYLIPRAILIYALVHRTMHMPRMWMKYSLKKEDDPQEHGHGHGHGGGHDDDDDDHGEHGAVPKKVEKRRQEAVEDLGKALRREGFDAPSTKGGTTPGDGDDGTYSDRNLSNAPEVPGGELHQPLLPNQTTNSSLAGTAPPRSVGAGRGDGGAQQPGLFHNGSDGRRVPVSVAPTPYGGPGGPNRGGTAPGHGRSNFSKPGGKGPRGPLQDPERAQHTLAQHGIGVIDMPGGSPRSSPTSRTQTTSHTASPHHPHLASPHITRSPADQPTDLSGPGRMASGDPDEIHDPNNPFRKMREGRQERRAQQAQPKGHRRAGQHRHGGGHAGSEGGATPSSTGVQPAAPPSRPGTGS